MAEKIGVVLFNLGGPDSLDAVEPFLYNLFQDPDIFSFPLAFLFRKAFAKIISRRRARKSRVYFEYMGGKSPITELTLKQAEALERKLNESRGEGGNLFKVVVAMRYWKPFTQEALAVLRAEGIRKVVLLPLYPQYSYATTRSSEREWDRQCKKMRIRFEKEIRVSSYAAHPLYLKAMAARIQESLEKFPLERRSQAHLLFSAHGIPMKEVAAGDPYETQIHESMRGILKELNLPNPSTLSYQSKVGPLKWLEPKTLETIERLTHTGTRWMIAIPLSFVSDHSETLYELKKLYGDLALKRGVEQYELMPALNDQPLFIECLREIVLSKLSENL